MNQTLEAPSSSRSLPIVTVDLAAVKARQQQVWASGDFAVIGTTLQLVGESLCEAADLRAGSFVLDVACGNGNAALAAAHRACKVVGLDYVPTLLERARERAAAERLAIEFVEGDAEALPFPAETFDAVLSTFGVMFAPDQGRSAQELVRVVKRGGTIALASWTPEGFIGRLLSTVGRYVPPPTGVASPIYWGNEARLRELFPDVRSLRVQRRNFVFRYESAEQFIHVFRTFYGPTLKAFNSLDADGQERLAADIRALIEQFDSQRGERSVAIHAEYLETLLTR
jgi:ubiquinone/menaquinone biosynthesis C-methylase UbiE